MSLYTKEEFNKLSVMYDGDKDRDATSKIRGFLFRDYITIICLSEASKVCLFRISRREQEISKKLWRNLRKTSTKRQVRLLGSFIIN